jgi:mannan endo-1,4-beta-mannosidase
MNGNWFSWNGDSANRPADFVAMWRHVHDLFAHEGATNVT